MLGWLILVLKQRCGTAVTDWSQWPSCWWLPFGWGSSDAVWVAVYLWSGFELGVLAGTGTLIPNELTLNQNEDLWYCLRPGTQCLTSGGAVRVWEASATNMLPAEYVTCPGDFHLLCLLQLKHSPGMAFLTRWMIPPDPLADAMPGLMRLAWPLGSQLTLTPWTERLTPPRWGTGTRCARSELR